MLPTAAQCRLRGSLRWLTPLELNLQPQSPELPACALEELRLFAGSSISIEVRPKLQASRGKLLDGGEHCGTPVYAASFIRQRRIVLETELLECPALLRSILLHELFHFAWVRLGNPKRQSFGRLLGAEVAARARGELGESAGVAKAGLLLQSVVSGRHWRDYSCESFCDSAAYFLAGPPPAHRAFLAHRWIEKRRAWFAASCSGPFLV